MKSLYFAMAALVIVLAAPVHAQTTPVTSSELKAMVQKIKADKKLVVAKNLQLSDAEATAFWPVYDAYQNDLEALNKRVVAVVQTYADAYKKGPIPDGVAKTLLNDSLTIDEDEVKAKRAMVARLDKALPGAKATRYVQIENKIRAMIRMELAEGIPLVQ